MVAETIQDVTTGLRVSVNGETLYRAVRALQPAVAKGRYALPVCQNIRLALSGSYLSIDATNMETWTETAIEINGIGRAGAITVPAKDLLLAIKPLRGETITLISEHGDSGTCTLIVSAPGSESRVAGIDAEEMPLQPSLDGEARVYMFDAAVFQNMLTRVVPAAATDDARPRLSGLYLEPHDDGTLECAATDGYQLSRMTLTARHGLSGDPVIVPCALLRLISAVVGKVKLPVRMVLANGHVSITTHGIVFTAPLIDGKYIDYRQVIPTAQPYTRLTVLTKTFLSAVEACIPASRHDSALCTLQATDAGCTVLSGTIAAPKGTRHLLADARRDGPENAGLFDARMLRGALAALAACGITSVTLDIDKAKKDNFTGEVFHGPLLLRAVPDDDSLYLVMPMSAPR